LKAFAKAHSQRERKLEKQAEKLREERDKAIRTAHREGLPMKDIARVLKMSHQRVSQIVRS
jgi:DNA-directed RNA polymerase specialized sigma subunit